MNADLRMLIRYVNAATDLAEQCQKDIRAGKTYTDDTVSKLAAFITAAAGFEKTLSKVQKSNHSLN